MTRKEQKLAVAKDDDLNEDNVLAEDDDAEPELQELSQDEGTLDEIFVRDDSQKSMDATQWRA